MSERILYNPKGTGYVIVHRRGTIYVLVHSNGLWRV